MKYTHEPVMINEVIEHFNPLPRQYFIDCTLGGAGYTTKIAKKIGKNGKVLSIDLDEIAIKNAKQITKKNNLNNIILVKDNFSNLKKIVEKKFNKNKKFNGIVFDLGLSSAQLDDKKRGFSFKKDSSLNMSFGSKKNNYTNTTEKIINNWNENDLTQIIKDFGEERFAKKISKEIIRSRKENLIKTTNQLVKIINKAIPSKFHHGKIHPATRTFQALRIATNRELDSLEKALPQALDLLKKQGKIIIISYHSLEDRIVKKFFQNQSKKCICENILPICECNHKPKIKILTRKPLTPTKDEISKNTRARSAKMRIAIKII